MSEYISKIEFSRTIGRSERQITRDLNEGLPHRKKGRNVYISVAQAFNWYMERSTGKDGYEKAKVRLLSAQAEKTELEVETMRGKLVEVEQVGMVWGKLVSAFRARILSMPSRLAPQLANNKKVKEIEQILNNTLYEALEEISRYDATDYRNITEESGSGGENSSTTTKAKTQRVG